MVRVTRSPSRSTVTGPRNRRFLRSGRPGIAYHPRDAGPAFRVAGPRERSNLVGRLRHGQQRTVWRSHSANAVLELGTWNVDLASDRMRTSLSVARCGMYSHLRFSADCRPSGSCGHFEQLPQVGGWRFTSPTGREHVLAAAGPVAELLCGGRGRHRGLPSETGPHRTRTRNATRVARETDGSTRFGRLLGPAIAEAIFERGTGFERLHAGGPAVYRRVQREISLLSA